MTLSHEEQYYEWKIINMEEARKEMFKTAFVHVIVFGVSIAYYVWIE